MLPKWAGEVCALAHSAAERDLNTPGVAPVSGLIQVVFAVVTVAVFHTLELETTHVTTVVNPSPEPVQHFRSQ